MAESIGRKKSQRWISTSHGSYDGAGWESDYSGDEVDMSLSRQGTIGKLPTLPVLKHGKETHIQPDDSTSTNFNNSNFSGLKRAISLRSNSRPINTVNDDLDSLMDQISKEMTPKTKRAEKFPSLSEGAAVDVKTSMILTKESKVSTYIDNSLGTYEYDKEDEDKELEDMDYPSSSDSSNLTNKELESSKDGYFSSYLTRDHELSNADGICDTSNAIKQIDKIILQGNEASTSSPSLNDELNLYNNSDNETTHISYSDIELRNQVKDKLDKPCINVGKSTIIDKSNVQNEDVQKNIQLDNANISCKAEVESDQNISSTDIHNNDTAIVLAPLSQVNENLLTVPEHNSDTNFNHSESTYSSSSEEYIDNYGADALSYTKSFNGDVDNESFRFKSCSRASMLNSSEEDDIQTIKSYYIKSYESRDNIESSHHSSQKLPLGGIHIGKEAVENESESENSFIANTIPDTKEVENNDKDTINENDVDLRRSINLSGWKPDTDSFRHEFVQDIPQKPPLGYVIDQDGKLIDLNPSSMRLKRGTSTYSEVESTWNAFPHQENVGGDLETIDTKTIYDNQTIHNIPILLSNSEVVPQVPRGNVIMNLDNKMTNMGIKERYVHKPDEDEIAYVKTITIPQMDINKLLTNKDTHGIKISLLKEYMNDLKEFDGGLKIWINYALKSSEHSNDFIFEDYKVNNHVQEAYAHSDELTKRNTVSNTVANVNQNVFHLKKKVFSHSMKEKSKGLFSSISKKKL